MRAMNLLAGMALVSCIGCGSSSDTTTAVVGLAVGGQRYLLTDEPNGAIGVIAAREDAENGDSLVMFGRVGGSKDPWIDGRAAFTMLDASVTVVNDGEKSAGDDICLADCCASDRVACTALVKVVDETGSLVPIDSRQLLGLNDSDLIVVEGVASRDESGNFVMLADGVYVRR